MFLKIIRIALPFIILFSGVFGTWVLLNHKTEPKKHPVEKVIPIVQILETDKSDGSVLIETHAVTEADATFSIAPQVGGKVTWVNSEMKEGKKVKKDTKLFIVEPTDYELAVQQAKADLVEARYDLNLVLAKQKAAIKEYEAYQKVNKLPGSKDKLSPLAKYEPQVESAMGAFKSAEAGLKIAELDLKRTIVYAPEDGYFSSVSVNSGQILTKNESVAELIKIQPIVLNTPISLSNLEFISFEGNRINNTKEDSTAVVSKKIGSKTHYWQGKVKRKMSELDSTSRNAQILIEVDQILSDKGLELPVGMFADVTINGRFNENVVGIPIHTIRPGNTVWIISQDNKLEIRNVTIKKETDQIAYISQGLESGERLITSSVTAPVPGMTVKIFNQNKQVKIVDNSISAQDGNFKTNEETRQN